jgi:hypothetical protein
LCTRDIRLTMSKVAAEPKSIQDLVDSYPNEARQSGQDNPQYGEKSREWCLDVAVFTNEMCGSEVYASKIRERMNRNITALEEGKPARETYNELVDILISDYRNIARTGSAIEIEGEFLDYVTEGPLPSDEFGEKSQNIIRSTLLNPLDAILHFRYEPGLSALSDPFADKLLERLGRSKEYYEETQKTATSKRNRTVERLRKKNKAAFIGPRNPKQYTVSSTPWSLAFDKLTKELESPESKKASPWIWLGINMTHCLQIIPGKVFNSFSLPRETLETICERLLNLGRYVGQNDAPAEPGSHYDFSAYVHFAELVNEAFQHAVGDLELFGRQLKNDGKNDSAQAQVPEADNELLTRAEFIFRQMTECWKVRFQGEIHHIQNLCGMTYIARLLRKPNKLIHVSAMENPSPGITNRSIISADDTEAFNRSSGSPRKNMKDTKDEIVLIRKRMSEIDNEIEEANELYQEGKACALADERDELGKRLSDVFYQANIVNEFKTETARTHNRIEKAIKTAYTKLSSDTPLWQHLNNSITYTKGHYTYAPDKEIEWLL